MPIAPIISLQYEVMAYLSVEHKITGFAKLTDVCGNGEFSTQKWIWVEMGNFLPSTPDMDGYGSGRTGWSGVGLKILPREGLYPGPSHAPLCATWTRGVIQ